ncbi:ExbD/TolR family protein [Acaryochloris marina]|uniref:ExbD/TolR family protein n=1 Tax=Acaryochloris marina TaxID=155978 RepID=UPI001EE6856C|nr:hypothetical protein [Acaryochloris marina]
MTNSSLKNGNYVLEEQVLYRIVTILSFFIIATLFLNRSDAFPVNLPRAKTVKPQLLPKVTVTIDVQGDSALNREPIQLNSLEA